MRTYDVVSADSHLEVPPDLWRSYVDPAFRRYVPTVVRLPDDSGDAWEMPGGGLIPLGLQFAITRPGVENRYRYSKPIGISYSADLVGSGDGERRLRELDEDRVDADLLFPAIFGTRGLDLPVEVDVAICRGYNDWLSQEYTAADPERLLGLAILPKGGIEEAIDEMRRVAGTPGIYGVVNFPACEPGDDRFFEAALELGMPLCSHASFPSPNVSWPPADIDVDLSKSLAGTGCVKYMLSGVLDRLPDLKIFCAETFCGWLAYTYDLLDSWYQEHGLFVGAELSHLPSEYMKRHFRWSFIVDPLAVRLRHRIGIDTIMWSTDFPHMNTDWPLSLRSIEEQMGDIPADERRRIVRDNAVELFKLPRSGLTARSGMAIGDVISANSHLEVSPDVWRSYVDAEFRSFVPTVTEVDGSAAWTMPVTGQVVALPPNLFLTAVGSRTTTVSYDRGLPGTGDATQRLRELDDDDIAAEVLLPPFFGRRTLPKLPGEASIAVCRGYNDFLRDYTAAAPERLLGVGLLPAATLADSSSELARVATMPGVRGLQLSQWPNGSGAPSPDDDAFWADAQASSVTLVVHREFGGGAADDPTRVDAHFFTISFLTTKGGAPYSASELMTTGVFDRFPDLRLYYVHGSIAWVEYWGEQADDHYLRHRYWAGSDLPHPPSHYVKQNLMFDFSVDPVGLEIRDMLNLDNLMWGRAFPTSGGTWPNTSYAIDEQFAKAGVDEAVTRKLVNGNARAFFGLDAPEGNTP